MRAGVLTVTVLLSLAAACKPAPDYAVTAVPLNLIGPGHPGHCIAIDLREPKDVFTWEPAPSGCSRRSTDVSRPDKASVTTGSDGRLEVRYEMQLMVGGPLQVRLVLQAATLKNLSTGNSVSTVKRTDLNVPDMSIR